MPYQEYFGQLPALPRFILFYMGIQALWAAGLLAWVAGRRKPAPVRLALAVAAGLALPQALAFLCVSAARRLAEAPGGAAMPAGWMAVCFLIQGLAGGTLMGCLLGGIWIGQDRSHPVYASARLGRACAWFYPAWVARLLAMGLSLRLAAMFNPISGHFFFMRVLDAGSTLFTVRLICWLWPAWLVAEAWLCARRHEPRAGALHLAPALVLACLGELLAAGLALGLRGVAL